MQLSEKHKEYWHKNLVITAVLLSIWFVVTFVEAWFARELNQVSFFGFPLGFYGIYAWYMNRLDVEYGVDEGDEG
jgi:putative solute:sodium symporter small subunit